MTSTSYLASSVEASRLRFVEQQEAFFQQATAAERRALDVAQACGSWAPPMSSHHLGSDKFVVLVEPGSSTDLSAAFHLKSIPGFQVSVLNPLTCYVRCQIFEGDSPERYVLEQVALAFLPF